MKENKSQKKNSEREGKYVNVLNLGALVNDILSYKNETLNSAPAVPKILRKYAVEERNKCFCPTFLLCSCISVICHGVSTSATSQSSFPPFMERQKTQ